MINTNASTKEAIESRGLIAILLLERTYSRPYYAAQYGSSSRVERLRQKWVVNRRLRAGAIRPRGGMTTERLSMRQTREILRQNDGGAQAGCSSSRPTAAAFSIRRRCRPTS